MEKQYVVIVQVNILQKYKNKGDIYHPYFYTFVRYLLAQ